MIYRIYPDFKKSGTIRLLYPSVRNQKCNRLLKSSKFCGYEVGALLFPGCYNDLVFLLKLHDLMSQLEKPGRALKGNQ